MKKKKNTVSLMTCFSFIMVWVAMILIPLYVEDKYYNMLQAKAHILLYGTAAVCVVAAIPFITEKNYRKLYPGKMNTLDWCILAFSAAALVSGLLSGAADSLTGMSEWGMGSLSIIAGAAIYFLISRNYINNRKIWIPVIIVNIFIMIIAALDAANLDPLRMHAGMSSLVYDYISTIGQKNWMAVYLCLIYPLIFMFYIQAEKKWELVLSGTFLAAGTAEVIFCSSDSVFLGFGICLLFLVPYVFSDSLRVRRFSEVLILAGTEVLLIRYLPCFADVIQYMDGISEKIVSGMAGIPVIAAGAAGVLAAEFVYGKLKKRGKRILIIIIEILLIAGYTAVGVLSLRNFSDTWGSYRGMIWKWGFSSFLNDFTLKEKLIGLGPDHIRSVFSDLHPKKYLTVTAAHSSLLQTLLSMGITGAVVWVAFWAVLFFGAFREKIWKREALIWFLPLAAFFGQSFVNTTVATSYAVFCAILGIYAAMRQ